MRVAASGKPAQGAQASAPPSPHQAKKKFLIEALLIALRNSEIARVVDMGTLEYFLDSSYADMVRGSTLHLSTLWNVLVAEPGINPRMVFPPLLAFQSWQKQLGVEVVLPPTLDALSADERAAERARCPIQGADLERLLTARKITATTAPQPARPRAATARPRTEPARGQPVRKRTWVALVALVLAFAGGVLWLRRPRSSDRFDLAALSSLLALEKSQRSEHVMSAVIADAGFLALPQVEREHRVAVLFARAKRMGLTSLFLYDRDGGLRASAVIDAAGERITVTP